MDLATAVLNSTTSPAGILANVMVQGWAKQAVPALPPSMQWITTNFVTQVALVGVMFYKAQVIGDSLQMNLILAAVVIAALNVLNGKSPVGDLTLPSLGGFKLPGM